MGVPPPPGECSHLSINLVLIVEDLVERKVSLNLSVESFSQINCLGKCVKESFTLGDSI